MGAAACNRPLIFSGSLCRSFSEAGGERYRPDGSSLSPAYIDDFLTGYDGLRLANAFMRIPRSALRSAGEDGR
jgi:hypothetical protein